MHFFHFHCHHQKIMKYSLLPILLISFFILFPVSTQFFPLILFLFLSVSLDNQRSHSNHHIYFIPFSFSVVSDLFNLNIDLFTLLNWYFEFSFVRWWFLFENNEHHHFQQKNQEKRIYKDHLWWLTHFNMKKKRENYYLNSNFLSSPISWKNYVIFMEHF